MGFAAFAGHKYLNLGKHSRKAAEGVKTPGMVAGRIRRRVSIRATRSCTCTRSASPEK